MAKREHVGYGWVAAPRDERSRHRLDAGYWFCHTKGARPRPHHPDRGEEEGNGEAMKKRKRRTEEPALSWELFVDSKKEVSLIADDGNDRYWISHISWAGGPFYCGCGETTFDGEHKDIRDAMTVCEDHATSKKSKEVSRAQ